MGAPVIVSTSRSPGGMVYRKLQDLSGYHYDLYYAFSADPATPCTEDIYKAAVKLHGEERVTSTEKPIPFDMHNLKETWDRRIEAACTTEAVRLDQGKPMWNLLDWEFIHEVVLVLTKGASKYSPNNYKKGMNFSRPFNSLIRHVYSWWRGENNDPETGCSHLAHACANLIFLFRYTIDKEKYGDFDDRPSV